MTETSAWSETDASNNASPPGGWPEGMLPSGVNNSARMMMGALKRFWDRVNPFYATAGSATAFTLTPSVALAAYVNYELWIVRPHTSNSGADPTINISSLGARTVKKYSGGSKTTLVAGDIQEGLPAMLFYDGTHFVLINPTGSDTSIGTGDIANNAVTYAKMQDISATQRVLGRNSGGSGDPQEVTLSQLLDWIGSAAQGDILYRGASTWSRLAKGTASQQLRMNSGATAPEWFTPSVPFSASFESSEQAIDYGNDISVAHGLGGTPEFLTAVLRCKSTDLGYAVGDEVSMPVSRHGGDQATYALFANSTNVGMAMGASDWQMPTKTGGTPAAIDHTKWRILLRAFR